MSESNTSITKVCTTCGQEKPLSDYHKHPSGKHGRNSKCKICVCEYAREYGTKNRARRLAYMKERFQNNKEIAYQRKRAYRQANPDKVKAWSALTNALNRGKITPEPCEICGATSRVSGHHEDYTKPLDVKWLCPLHHRRLHVGLFLVTTEGRQYDTGS